MYCDTLKHACMYQLSPVILLLHNISNKYNSYTYQNLILYGFCYVCFLFCPLSELIFLHCCVFMCLIMFFSVLPGRRSLDFPYCGVKVDLSFSALFSNVLVVFGTVRNTSAKAQDCTLILESEPVSHSFSCPLSLA